MVDLDATVEDVKRGSDARYVLCVWGGAEWQRKQTVPSGSRVRGRCEENREGGRVHSRGGGVTYLLEVEFGEGVQPVGDLRDEEELVHEHHLRVTLRVVLP